MSIQIIETEDGSHSLFNPDLKETYHSFHGALQESVYVYIKQGLDFVKAKDFDKISILEVGFGTGLNVLLSLAEALKERLKIEMVTLEPYPLNHEIISSLNYPDLLSGQSEDSLIDYKLLFKKIHDAPWNVKSDISENFLLMKSNTTVQKFEPEVSFDLIYFDAFAPSKQIEIWAPEIFEKLYSSLNKDGVLVTYCAQGQFKRNLASAGFHVEALKGPPGKKEMVRARKI